jgi:nicotinamide riboside kinase
MYDVIVCDRIAFDYLVYAKYYGVELSNAYHHLAVDNAREFDMIYFVRPDDTPIADDGFRFTDLEERNRIDRLFLGMLEEAKISYIEIKTEDIFK